MQVEYGLACGGAIVLDQPETILGIAIAVCQYGRLHKQVTNNRLVLRGHIEAATEVLFGDQEQMQWCFRRDILNGNHHVVFIDNRCWNGSFNNFTEDTVHGVTPGLFVSKTHDFHQLQ